MLVFSNHLYMSSPILLKLFITIWGLWFLFQEKV